MKDRVIKKIVAFVMVINLVSPFGFVSAEDAPNLQEVTPQEATQVQPAASVAPEATGTEPVAPAAAPAVNPAIEASTATTPPPTEVIAPTSTQGVQPVAEAPRPNEGTAEEDYQKDQIVPNNDSNNDHGNDHGSDDSHSVENDNIANIINEIWGRASTGENTAKRNDEDVAIETGDANSVLDLINFINSNFTTTEGGEVVYLFKNIYASLYGDYIIDPLKGDLYDLDGNKIIGDMAKYVENSNLANVINNINLGADTGYNEASFNDGDTSIATGDASTVLNMFNLINTNFIASEQGLFGAVNIFGDFFGDLVIPKWLTAAFSGSGKTTENKTVATSNNQATIANNIDASANTGNNELSFNDQLASLATGDANALINLKNIANTNIAEDVIFFLLVNVTGDWEGKSALPLEYLNPDDGSGLSFLVTNLFGGASSTEITNNNSALLTNNINLWANTGGNEVSHNDGNGSIITGDANVIANIINIANANLIGKRVVFLTVNIFGDWYGDIEEAQEKQSVTGGESSGSNQGPIIIVNTKNKAKKKFNNLFAAVSKNNFEPTAFDDGSRVEAENSQLPTDEEIAEAEAVLGKAKDLTQEFLNNNWLSKARPYLVVLLVIYLGFLSVYLRRGSINKG